MPQVFALVGSDAGQPVVATPTFSPAAGSYSGGQTVRVSSATPGAMIYITFDGSTPTVYSPSFPSGQRFTVPATMTLKVIAMTPGYIQSAVASATYTIGSSLQITTPATLPGATATVPYTTGSPLVTMAASGGTAPYTWALESEIGTNTWTVDAAGHIYGTPLNNETDALTIQVTDSATPTPNVASGVFSTTVSGATHSYPVSQFVAINAGSNYTNSTWQAGVAKYNYVLLQGAGFQTTDFQSVIAAIHSAAAGYAGHSCNVGFYAEDFNWFSSTSGGAAQDPAKVNFGLGNAPGAAPGGYLRSSWPSGSFVGGVDGSNHYQANETDLGPIFNVTTVGSISGPGNVNWSQFNAWYEWNLFTQGNGGPMGCQPRPACSLVGHVIHDGCAPFSYSGMIGCWASNSTVYNPCGNLSDGTFIHPHMEKGWQQSFQKWRTLQPGILMGGNFTAYVAQGSQGPSGANWACTIPGGFADCGTFENLNGYALGYIGGSTAFQTFMARCIAAQSLMFGGLPSQCQWELEYAGPGQGGVNAFPNAQTSFTAAHYRGARVQMGMCLGLQWCIGFSAITSQNENFIYFDELDAGVGTPGWLGTPTNIPFFNTSGIYLPPNAAANLAYSTYGVMTFTYANGNVYLFPPGAANAAVGSAVTLPTGALQNGGGHHISYPLAGANGPPNITPGAAFTSLYIQPYDAVFTKL